MKGPPGNSRQGVSLRSGAEKRLKGVPALGGELPATQDDTLKLLHELQVHQIELEMQNEELVRSHEELRVSRDRYSLLYNFAPVGYFNLSRDLTIRSANFTASGMLEKERSRLVNGNFLRCVAPHCHAQLRAFMDQVFACRQKQSCEVEAVTKKPLFMHLEAVVLDSGEECLLAAIDITPRKRLEQALCTAREELEERVSERTIELALSMSRQQEEMEGRLRALEELRSKELLLIQQSRLAALGEMLGNIAHQWRQPLNVIGLLTQQIGLYEGDEVNLQLLSENVTRIMNLLNFLSQTIDDFQSFTLPEKSKVHFRVSDVVAKTVHMVGELFRCQGITLSVDTDDATHMHGFPNEFGQVLMILLMNARDACGDSRVGESRVAIRSWTENGHALLTVKDNAGGVGDDIREKIFDPYFTTKELGKGSGIGLFMAKMIIEKNMGGKLSVSNIDGGAEFRIEV
jgi:C4-dicarboxylate-specific signal transduction histidine kinase